MGVPSPQRDVVPAGGRVGNDPTRGLGAARPFVAPVSTAGFVIISSCSALLEREDLRNRLIGLIGPGHLAVTTRAFDEAGSGQPPAAAATLVNTIYGAIQRRRLWLRRSLSALLGAPPAWGCASFHLVRSSRRSAVLISLAALPGPLESPASTCCWGTVHQPGPRNGTCCRTPPGFCVLLVAVAFWTWLWGPLGLLMATPLTVCLVVVREHVPGLKFVATLLSDTPARRKSAAIAPPSRAMSAGGIDVQKAVEKVCDALLVPALNYAERDRLEGSARAGRRAGGHRPRARLMERRPARSAPSGICHPRLSRRRARPATARARLRRQRRGDSLALEMHALVDRAADCVGDRRAAPPRTLIALVGDKRALSSPSPTAAESVVGRAIVRRCCVRYDLPCRSLGASGAGGQRPCRPLTAAHGSTLLRDAASFSALAHLDTKPGPDRAHAA
jgi:hypothetical protein